MLMVSYLHLRPEGPLPGPVGEPFRAAIVADANVSDGWRTAVSDWLIGGGCLYVVAWGVDCDRWEHAADTANIERFDHDEIPDEHFVTTTCHENEPLSDALWFCRECAFHSTVDLERTLIVHIAMEAREALLLNTYREAEPSE